MRSLSILVCFTSLLLACGSSTQKTTEDPAAEPGVQESDAQAEETAEQKFARQQSDTVHKMCQRLIDCSIEDARASLSPEEFAKLDPEKIAPKAIADCTQEADKAPLSPRQVIGIRECLGAATSCPVFNECLGSAGQTES